jgi:phage gp36-like protein
LTVALRGIVKDSSDMTAVKRAAVRAISNYTINNLLESVEKKQQWDTTSNLGGDLTGNLGRYPLRDRDSLDPTPDDFIQMYGLKEAIQISNIDDASACEPNLGRIWRALQDACALIDAYISQTQAACIKIVSSTRARTACIIARYYLDSVRRRKDITEDYERAIKEINDACDTMERPTGNDDLAINNGGILRTCRIPQYYNGVTGKGFSGWWVDTAANIERDWRNNRSYYNSENNNNEENYRPTRGKNPTEQPTDGGGSTQSGGTSP